MIAFLPERITRVREYLDRHDWQGDAGSNLVRKVLSQSYKVQAAVRTVAECIGAMAYLLTGEPEEFENLPVAKALELAERLFKEPERATPDEPARGGLLLVHARRVLTAQPRPQPPDIGYVDWEDEHLVLLGGRELFLQIVRAMTALSVGRNRSHPNTPAQALVVDAALWIRPEVLRRAFVDQPRRE